MTDKSKEFIKWADEYLSDGYNYNELLRKAIADLQRFKKLGHQKGKDKILKKLTASAEIYGAPEDEPDKYNIQKEIEAEIIDITGWRLVGMRLKKL